jgi:hypothetical protein
MSVKLILVLLLIIAVIMIAMTPSDHCATLTASGTYDDKECK